MQDRPCATSFVQRQAWSQAGAAGRFQAAIRKELSGTKGTKSSGPSVSVSKKVLDQCEKQGLGQAQITVVGFDPKLRGQVSFCLEGEKAVLTFVKGDTHALWANHQTDKQAFWDLFQKLAEKAGTTVAITVK